MKAHGIGGALIGTATIAFMIVLPCADALRGAEVDGAPPQRERRGEVLPPFPFDAGPSVAPHAVQLAEPASLGRYGVDVRVNDPSLDRTEMTTQSETTLAIRGSTICLGYNNTRKGGIPN